ncbi:MAG: sugar kinase [Phycisphaerales bacterium]|nr:sugar kinase [Phycisphaerales bacterium]
MSLVVTGTVGIDSVYTPTGHAEKVLGGSCTYFSAAASFYTPVKLVAAVGGDFAPSYREVFKTFPNIDISGLESRPASKTFAWGGKYHENMDSRETLFTELGVLTEAPPPVPAAHTSSEYVFLANSHPGVQLSFLRQFPKRKLAVADTMDLWINIAKDDLKALLNEVDGLVLNYDEAELFTGKKNPVTAAKQIIAESKLTFVVVKKGEHGCLFVHKDGVAMLPAYPAEQVIDPTGAGDTFAGGMMGYIAANHAHHAVKDRVHFEVIQKALAHGTVVASYNIESFTLSRLLTLKKAELDARYAEFAKMVRV